MYWTRADTLLQSMLYIPHSLAWLLGGWLLARSLFRLRPVERLSVGVGVGLASYVVLSNLLAQVLPALGLNVSAAFWAASLLVLAAGMLAAGPGLPGQLLRRRGAGGLSGQVAAAARFEHLRRFEDLQGLQPLLVVVLLTALFASIGRGLSIFDDYLHVPMVSMMAAGDIPPHFHLQPDVPLAYHYGLQVLAASMVRLGGFFPWSAWDASKGLAIALSTVLGYLWLRRRFHSPAALLGAFLYAAGSGARYLLLFLPENSLKWVSNGVSLAGSAADTAPTLIQALAQPWLIEGGGPFPFPFAYHSGIFASLFMALGASGAFPALLVLLLLLLAGREKPTHAVIGGLWTGALIGLALAALALSGEHIFVPLWGGVLLAMIWRVFQSRRRKQRVPGFALQVWGVALFLSAVLSAVQGGFVTEVLRGLLGLDQVSVVVQGGYTEARLVPQWPPALYSGHLGSLSLFSGPQLVALLAELGPALLALPLAGWYAWRSLRRRSRSADWLGAALGLTALASLGVPLVLKYGFERSGTRLPATALWLALVLAFPIFKQIFDRGKRWLRLLLAAGYVTTVLSGVVVLALQLIAMPYEQLAYFIEPVDAQISSMYWERLPAGAQVLDANAPRSAALFGRPQRAHRDLYNPDPAWEALVSRADASEIARAGYDFVYIDRNWWQKMDDNQRGTFQAACVKTLAEKSFAEGGFRRLFDVRSCRDS